MSTEFINDQWRLPNEENKSKVSNYSMDFDGSSQYIETSSIDVTGVKSFSFWLKRNSSTTNDGAVMTFVNTGKTDDYMAIGLWNGSADTGALLNAVTDNAGNTVKSNQSEILTDVWYHFVVIKSATAITAIYINGVSETLDSGGMYYATATAPQSYLGRADFSGSNFYANIKIDAVAIFDYALSASQVTTLYGSSSTGIGNPMSLSPKPVAYYNLGDKSAFNSSSYLIPNSSLQDFVFDFDTSRIQVSSQSLGITSQICISAWVKIPDGSTGGASSNIQQIVSEDTTGGTSRNWVLSWRGGSYEDFYFAVFHSDGTSTALYSNVGDINDGKWHHVVGTWDGTTNANAFKIYVDNVATSTTSTKTDIRATSNIPTTIGAIPNAFTRAFDGNISNVQIWDTNLSSTEVETLYNNGSPLQNLNDIPQNSNLQGWWKLDASATYDSSTTTWTIPDDSTNSNDGTSSGMTQANLVQSDLSFTSGYSPFALDFDSASGDYIEVSNNTALQITGDITISAWVYAESDTGRVVSKRGAGGTNYDFFIQSRYLRLYDGVSGPLSTGRINLNEWSHILISVNSGTGTYYINNVVSGTGTFSISSVSTSQPFYIGGSFTPALAYFNGKLSNVSIWNTDLTSAQITEIYNEGVPSNLNNHSAYSNLVSWWQLGSNSSFNTNWTVLDEKGSNNGTSSNMGEDAIVDGVNTYANGLSSGMGGDEVIGDAPYSTANALSVNMDVEDRITDTPS